MIPITKPYFSEEEEKKVIDAMKSGWVSQGPRVAEFEEKIAGYTGSRYAVATTSCTTALFLALKAAGIKKDDEVICPSFSFIATANAIVHTGAVPRFVDIDPSTYNINPALAKKAVTGKTRAIVPVHQMGLSADLDEINKIAQVHGLAVIEDAACAIGSEYKGRKIGFGRNLTCFSFHPRKILVTGEGGMITTNDTRLAEKLKRLRHHGAPVSGGAYTELGYNFRMTDIQASLGIAQLYKLGEMLKKRRELAMRYNEAFSKIEFLSTPFEPEYAKHNYQSYILRVNDGSPVSRDELSNNLCEAGIAATRGIMAIHREPFYKQLLGGISLPNTENASDNTLIIPLYPSMSDEEQNYVINQIQKLQVRK